MQRFSCVVLLLLAGATCVCAELTEPTFELPLTDHGLHGEGPIRRYDWFKNLWKQKRAAWARDVVRDQGALVFLGDSITQGWGPAMNNAFKGVKVANRGISGDTTRGMLLRLHDDVISLNPSGVVLLMGTNDLEEGATPETIAGNLKLIIAALKAHNEKMPIVLCNVFPSAASKKRSADKIKQINKLYANAVKGDPQITLLDTWTLFADPQGDAKLEEFPDLLHPNKVGYQKWAAALRPILATLGFHERDADDWEVEPGYTSLFNGYDLDGWQFRPSTEQDKQASTNWRKRDPNAPPWPILTETVNFDNQTATPDGRYLAKNGRLVVTTPPEGRKIQQFWTQREFPQDFVLKLEFRATPNADSGIFIRGKQLQCRDYWLAGPYKELKEYRPQDWNEVVVVVEGDRAYCTCNGEVLEKAFPVPATGPIGLEGDRGQVEYRRIRFKEISGELPRSRPEQQGVSSRGILSFVQALDNLDAVHSFMLLRHGTVIAEGWWSPFTADDPHQLYSLSKSFTSTAVGLAREEGKLSLDDQVISFFPDDLPEETSNNLTSMRVRDLLSMSTGHDGSDLGSFSFQADQPLTKQFLALPVKHRPGTHFLYNTPATYMCSAIVQKVTGEKLLDYLQPRLFSPLGIAPPSWSESAQGISHGGYGLSLRTEDIARFGQLYLQKGEWNGRQLIPREWVDAATARQTSNGSDPDSDWAQGYGYQFWRCRHNCYRGDGAFGQFCIVMPEFDVVLAVTSGTGDMGFVMQQAWDHLLPAIRAEPLPRAAGAEAELTDRLAKLELPVVAGTAFSSSAAALSNTTYHIEGQELPIDSIRFSFRDDQSVLTYRDEVGEHRLAIGQGTWMRGKVDSVGGLVARLPQTGSIGVAASGAWATEDTYHVKLWLYETPYRVDVSFQFKDKEVVIESSQNVAFGSKIKPTMTGRAE